MTAARARSAPHRFTLDDVAPPASKVSAADAVAEIFDQGVADEITGDDLEIYRLLMSPAEFRRFEHRLAKALAAHWEESNRTRWATPELPFGTDLDHVLRIERLRAWTDRPNGEPFPTTWTIHPDFTVPGRLKLVAGREFSVWGFRGRLLFRHAVTTTDGECWVDGWDEDGRCRSITPDRIRTVHRTTRRRHPHGGRR